MAEQAEQEQYAGQAKEIQFSARQEKIQEIPGSLSFDEREAIARVVAVDDDRVWLEPIQTGSCGGCVSAAACGGTGIGTIANRLEARRFAIRGRFGLRVGDEVVVGFGDANLVKAAAIAYAIPLFFAIVTAAVVQSYAGRDGLTLLGTLAGLAAGFAVMKVFSARLEARGALRARIVRRPGQAIQFFPTGT